MKGKKRTFPGVGKEIKPGQFLTLKAAAEAVQVTERAILQAVVLKQLRGRKTGSGWRFTGRALMDYVEGGTPLVGSSSRTGKG